MSNRKHRRLRRQKNALYRHFRSWQFPSVATPLETHGLVEDLTSLGAMPTRHQDGGFYFVGGKKSPREEM